MNYVLACVNPPSVWNFYPTPQAAEAAQPEVNAREEKQYRVMTYEAYKLAERAFYVYDEPTQITEAKFHEMLNVLPPMCWRNDGYFESFLMSEFWSGPYTHQYARRGETYWAKMVDATDRTTWMKA